MNDAPAMITLKETEAVMWCLGQIVNYPKRKAENESDPLFVLLSEGFPRPQIMKAGEAMFETIAGSSLIGPLTPIQKAILRVCIENTTWVTAYVQNGPAGGTAEDCKKTLRGLATKLERLGVEINHIPND